MNVRDVLVGDGFDVVAGQAVFTRQCKKSSHLIEGEAQLASSPDE
jgi:hypothetical protein